MAGMNLYRRRPQLSTGVLILVVFFVYLCFRSEPPSSETLSKVNELVEIPRKIWQVYFGYSKMGTQIELVGTWLLNNQDFRYTLVSNDGADDFARTHYHDQPDVLSTFLQLRFPVFRSDLIRYMILDSEGGIYSDLDTESIKPVNDWVPAELKTQVHAVIGIEYDQRNDEPYFGMPVPLQFCQWTVATTPGHPIARNAVSIVVKQIHELVNKNQVTIGELNPSDDEVVQVTGPLIWTKVVFDALSEATGTNMSFSNLTGMTEPKLFGDIYVLPVNGFGAGQPHSGSWRGEGHPPDALIRHGWKGSWKHGWHN